MERKKFFIGVFVLTGLVLGSLFTNAVYKCAILTGIWIRLKK